MAISMIEHTRGVFLIFFLIFKINSVITNTEILIPYIALILIHQIIRYNHEKHQLNIIKLHRCLGISELEGYYSPWEKHQTFPDIRSMICYI